MLTQTPPPSQLSNDEAIAMLPQQEVITVLQRHALPGKLDQPHRWHRDFAADKIRHRGAHKAWDAPSADYALFFTDENGDRFFLKTTADL